MELTPEYLAEQKDCIQRNFDGYKRNSKDPITIKRLQNLKAFIMDFSPTYSQVLSVGSGGFEPHWIGSTYACDVDELSSQLLKDSGWTGIFFPCSCDDIPYPAKFFRVAICSEVIEHLPSKEIVRVTFSELNRVAKHWLVTTPTRDVKEPTHKFIFTEEDLKELSSNSAANFHPIVEKQGLFFYIHNGQRKIFS